MNPSYRLLGCTYGAAWCGLYADPQLEDLTTPRGIRARVRRSRGQQHATSIPSCTNYGAREVPKGASRAN